MESTLDLNIVLLPALFAFGGLAALSGGLLLVKMFVFFRARINRSLNADLETVQVSKPTERKGEAPRLDQWKEEIGAMEQLLVSLQSFRGNRDSLDILSGIKRFFYGPPSIVFEAVSYTHLDVYKRQRMRGATRKAM